MAPLKIISVASTLVLAVGSLACKKSSGEFEGEITLRITRDGPPSDMVFETARGYARVGMTQRDGNAYALVKPDGIAVFVMEPQKTWSDLNMAKSRAVVEAANPNGQPTVVKTGKHETIAGRDCEQWEIKHTSGKRTEACIAEGLVGFDLGSLMPGAGPFASQSSDEVKQKKLFPLRSVEFDAKGEETSRMVVTKIEPKSIDAKRFEVPAGFSYVPAK